MKSEKSIKRIDLQAAGRRSGLRLGPPARLSLSARAQASRAKHQLPPRRSKLMIVTRRMVDDGGAAAGPPLPPLTPPVVGQRICLSQV